MFWKISLSSIVLLAFTAADAKSPNQCQKSCVENYSNGINKCTALHPDKGDDYWNCVEPYSLGYEECMQGCKEK